MGIYKRKYEFGDFKQWLFSLLLLPVMIWLIFNHGRFIVFIDHFNLLIHEGGHGIFRIFGDFLYTLGGSMMQIILPLIFVFYFYSNGKRFGIQLSLIWLGENLMNVGVYAADARTQSLPLLGGNKVYHDWNWILTRLNLLEYDKLIGDMFFYAAVIIFIISFLTPMFFHIYEQNKIKLDL